MTTVCDNRLAGEFKGWDGKTVFKFDNGQAWQQDRYEYYYRYSYRPRAKVVRDGGRHYLEVEGTNRRLEVRKL